MSIEKKIAEGLLSTKAVRLSPDKPFKWASGWNSPIYCDNRVTLSYPQVRAMIRDSFVERINEAYKNVDVIAGVATGAIAQGALVAEKMGLPFIYVRSAPKSHGMENLIEGYLEKGKKVVVIEDLISTGGSSLKAVEAIRQAGCEVLGMAAIFSYGFQVAIENFKEADCKLVCLSNYSALLELAKETGYVVPEHFELLKKWAVSPDTWMK